jgi:hypothetical protein
MQKENTDNLIEVYKTILQQEISNHTIVITVLLSIVVILLGATWWWNKSGATKEIKSEVGKIFEKEKKKLYKEFENEINKIVDEKIKDCKEQILVIEGDVARSMGISARNSKFYSHSIYWLAKFLKTKIDLEDPQMIRSGTEWILQDLVLLKEKDVKTGLKTIHECKYVMEIVSELPELLEKEKKEILKICEGREEIED